MAAMKAVLGIGATCSIILLTLLYFSYVRQEIDIMPGSKSFVENLTAVKPKCATNTTTTTTITINSNNCLVPTLSIAYDSECKPCKIETGIHLITNFFPPIHPRWRKGLTTPKANTEAEKKELVEKRQQELQDVLQKNLNHKLITAVYVLYEHPFVFYLLTKLNFKNKDKLVLHKVDKDPTYRHALDYANAYLMGRLVVFTNQDIYLGEGWELLNVVTMREKKIMYALSRHGHQERYCFMWSTCDRTRGYIGSHDTYAFVLKEKLNEDGLRELDHQSDNYGLENVLIWAFKIKFQFNVLNPCFKLKTYHDHCTNTHNVVRPRINGGGKSGSAGFTDQLE